MSRSYEEIVKASSSLLEARSPHLSSTADPSYLILSLDPYEGIDSSCLTISPVSTVVRVFLRISAVNNFGLSLASTRVEDASSGDR